MNPAALKTNVGDLPAGGALIVNSDAFTQQNLNKAAYASNPLTDGSLKAYTVFEVPISTLNERSLDGLDMTSKQKDLTKNFFALGLMFWLYEREPGRDDPLDRPEVRGPPRRGRGEQAGAQGRLRVRRDDRGVPHPLPRPPARSSTRGPTATSPATRRPRSASWPRRGWPTATLFYGSYPITPGVGHPPPAVRLQDVRGQDLPGGGRDRGDRRGDRCELRRRPRADRLVRPGHRAQVGGDGPRGHGRAAARRGRRPARRPLDGMPTKNEQADLLQVMFGRNGDSPMPVVAPATPGECFDLAIEAARLALKYMTPVVYLSDAFLATGSEPWRIPSLDDLPGLARRERDRPGDLPAVPARSGHPRPALGGPRHARPRASHRRAREGRHHRQRQLRPGQPPPDAAPAPGARWPASPTTSPPLEVFGPDHGDLLILGWGSTYGAIRSAVERLHRPTAGRVAHAHLRHLNPFPANTEKVLRSYRRVLIPEVNLGQLLLLVRARYLIDADGLRPGARQAVPHRRDRGRGRTHPRRRRRT